MPDAPLPPAGGPHGASGDHDPDDAAELELLSELGSFVASEDELLAGLASVLDALEAAGQVDEVAFDAGAVWDRVADLVWGENPTDESPEEKSD